MTKIRQFILVVCFFVCPLVFFTNLTRNPYITQITLLNMGLALLAALYFIEDAWKEGRLRLPRTPLDAPILAWLAVCLISWTIAYFGHVGFYRPSIISEGLRNSLFVLINALIPFYLSAAYGKNADSEEGAPLGQWVCFALGWGLLWLAFPQMRGPSGAGAGLWSHMWDAYGFALWAGGFAWAFALCRKGRIMDYFHLALMVAFLASFYGVLQYFNYEFLWPNVLNPYGGRSVSTFGNPNFLSSYNVIMLPVAAVLFLQARDALGRIAYGTVFLVVEAALLCSLTRSSWIGAFAALGVLLFFKDIRRRLGAEPRSQGLLLGAAVVMVFLWPQTSVSGAYTPSVMGRLTEITEVAKKEGFYSPLHQRLLIWTCGWLMGAENPLTGKGWGLFELFYPFYQGHILNHFDFYIGMRTHANNSHNEIVETWAQTGLLGVGVLFWMWATFFWAARKQARSGRPADQGLWTAAVAGTAGMLADNMLNVSLHFAVPGFLFWWVAGTAMGRAAQTENQWRVFRGPRWGRSALAAALALLCAWGAWYWVRVWNREVHYFSGFKLLRQGNMPAAIKELEISRNWGPREVNAIYELGNAYARSDRYPEAVKIYREALEANAGYDEIFFNIATIYTSKVRNFDEALPYYKTAWWINPLSNELYINLSALYLTDPARYRASALPLLERAVHFFPDNPNHWNNLGYLYSMDKRYAEAESSFARALTLNPDMAVAERNLASALGQSGHARPPVLVALQNLKALETAIAKGDYSPATLKLAESIAARMPDMVKARFFYGSLLVANRRPAEGAPHLEWVAAREPSNAGARINLGNAYLGLGRGDDAAREFKAALSSDPQNAFARQRLKDMGVLK